MLAALRDAQVLVDADALVRAIDQAAVRLAVLLTGENPVVLSVLNGALPFTAALLQRLHFPLELACIQVSRYRSATTGGELHWHARPLISLAGRHVLIVDDVLDQGLTLAAIRDWALEVGAVRVTVAVMVDKKVERLRPLAADVAALECPNRYLFGFGMDFQGYWRNLPAIYALAER
ncbi:MAG: hypoxanthine-guanine phosphoribosyltransferase [Pseudomonadales bacterium]|nr:hypoxanthine-guanine phosphoribosyltransferase [Pseudomonadales bacterium]